MTTNTPSLIDAHAHIAPPGFFRELARSNAFDVTVEETPAGFALTLPGLPSLRPAGGGLSDLGSRREWMESQSITTQILGPWLDLHGYSLPADKAASWARLLNEQVAACASDGGAPFQALATVPLRGDADLAARELEYAVKTLGAKGAILPSDPMDIDLASPQYEPIWAAAASLDVPVLLHGASHSKWTQVGPAYLAFSLGRTLDTTVLAAKLILTGLLDRHPRLKLLLCHGGGFLPYQIGRIAEGYSRGAEKQIELERGGPEAYLPLMYYDNLTLNDRSLRLLLDLAGSEHVMLGSDYVWDPASGPLTGALPQMGMSPDAFEAVCHGNATSLFRL